MKPMRIYADLGVPEVWRFKGDQLRFYVSQPDGAYKGAERSNVFPFLAPAELQPFLAQSPGMDEGELARRFMVWVEKEIKPRLNGGRKNGKRGKA